MANEVTREAIVAFCAAAGVTMTNTGVGVAISNPDQKVGGLVLAAIGFAGIGVSALSAGLNEFSLRRFALSAGAGALAVDAVTLMIACMIVTNHYRDRLTTGEAVAIPFTAVAVGAALLSVAVYMYNQAHMLGQEVGLLRAGANANDGYNTDAAPAGEAAVSIRTAVSIQDDEVRLLTNDADSSTHGYTHLSGFASAHSLAHPDNGSQASMSTRGNSGLFSSANSTSGRSERSMNTITSRQPSGLSARN